MITDKGWITGKKMFDPSCGHGDTFTCEHEPDGHPLCHKAWCPQDKRESTVIQVQSYKHLVCCFPLCCTLMVIAMSNEQNQCANETLSKRPVWTILGFVDLRARSDGCYGRHSALSSIADCAPRDIWYHDGTLHPCIRYRHS
jgi:hypothetical protein